MILYDTVWHYRVACDIRRHYGVTRSIQIRCYMIAYDIYDFTLDPAILYG